MSINNYMKKTCTDTFVYWGVPELQTDGSFSYDPPVEKNCFWRDKVELVRDDQGKEFKSVAVLYVLEDLEQGAMVFHGSLSDLSAGEQADPTTKTGAYEIKVFEKIPLIGRPNEVQRKILLGWRG